VRRNIRRIINAPNKQITDTRLAVSSLPYVATVLNSAGTPPTLHVNYKV